MTGEGIKKKRDPIFSVCFVVFVVACVGVLGVYVDEHYIQQDDTKVAFGDKVAVNYIGTYYAAYGEDNAVVFDTSIASIGKDDDITKSNDFSSSSYTTLSVTVGSNGALKMFEEALVGHKIGEKIQVEIPAGEGYVTSDGSVLENQSRSFTVPAIQKMSKTQFESIYDDVKLTAGTGVYITTAYGWEGIATLSSTDNSVLIQNMPGNQTYQYIGNDDSEFGKVTFSVNGMEGESYKVTIGFEETKNVGGNDIQMIKVNVDGTPVYITGFTDTTYDYKTCAEKDNITLFFEIEIVSINA